MIEVREYNSGNPIALMVDDIVAIKGQESQKRCYIYTRNEWFFDVRCEYSVLKKLLKRRRMGQVEEQETEDGTGNAKG